MRTETIRAELPDLVAAAMKNAARERGLTEGEWLTRAVQNALGREAWDEVADRLAPGLAPFTRRAAA